MGDQLSVKPVSIRLINFFSLLLVLAGILMIGSVIFLKTLQWLSGYEITDAAVLDELIYNVPASKKYFIIAQALMACTSFIMLPLLLIFFVWPELKEIFKFNTDHLLQRVLLAILIVVISMPFIALLSEWNKALIQYAVSAPELLKWMMESEKQGEKLTNLMAYYHSAKEFWAGLTVIALLPAVGEELLFRGLVQNKLKDVFLNPHTAVIITGFLFSFIHFQFFGFIPRMFLGILFGYIYYWSGNIIIPIAMHFTNNAVTYVALNFYEQKKIAVDMESAEDLPPTLITFSILLLVFLLSRFRKLSFSNNG
jgi:membrane protease YdiL (CAAX protease family)